MDKIIHQIWIGDNEMPDKIKNYTDSIKKMNPDYEYKLWGNELFSKYEKDPFFIAFVDNTFGKESYLSDIFRLLLLRDYGGIYCDTDMFSYKSFDVIWDFLNNYNIVFTSNPPFLAPEFTNNSFIFSLKNGYHINRLCDIKFLKSKFRINEVFNFKIIDLYLRYHNDENVFILPYYYMQSRKYNKEKESILFHAFTKYWNDPRWKRMKKIEKMKGGKKSEKR